MYLCCKDARVIELPIFEGIKLDAKMLLVIFKDFPETSCIVWVCHTVDGSEILHLGRTKPLQIMPKSG